MFGSTFLSSPILKDTEGSNLLDISPRLSIESASKRFENRLIELEKENLYLSERTKTADASRVKTVILERENSKLLKKIEKYKAQKLKLEEEYMIDIQLLQKTADNNTALERNFETQRNAWLIEKSEYESRIVDMGDRIVCLSEDLEKVRRTVSSELIDVRELKELEMKWKESADATVESLRRDISENYVPRAHYISICEDFQRTNLQRSIADESQVSLYNENISLREENGQLKRELTTSRTELHNTTQELHILQDKFKFYNDDFVSAAATINGIKSITAESSSSTNTDNTTRTECEPQYNQMSSILLETQLGYCKANLREEKRKCSLLTEQVSELNSKLTGLEMSKDEITKKLSQEIEVLHREASEREKELLEWKSNSFELEKNILLLEDKIQQYATAERKNKKR